MRLIDADAIPWTDLNADMPNTKIKVLITFADKVNRMPTIEERKKGKWSFIGDNMFECTCCGTPYTTQQLNGLRNYNTDPYAPKFCPNCGADMRGDDHEND